MQKVIGRTDSVNLDSTGKERDRKGSTEYIMKRKDNFEEDQRSPERSSSMINLSQEKLATFQRKSDTKLAIIGDIPELQKKGSLPSTQKKKSSTNLVLPEERGSGVLADPSGGKTSHTSTPQTSSAGPAHGILKIQKQKEPFQNPFIKKTQEPYIAKSKAIKEPPISRTSKKQPSPQSSGAKSKTLLQPLHTPALQILQDNTQLTPEQHPQTLKSNHTTHTHKSLTHSLTLHIQINV